MIYLIARATQSILRIIGLSCCGKMTVLKMLNIVLKIYFILSVLKPCYGSWEHFVLVAMGKFMF